MARYWVIGGEYADTRFDRPAEGAEERRYGPFATYAEAKAEWARRAWATVDDAHVRYRIEQDGRDGPQTEWWIVGGAYENTRFHEPVGGHETWHGPFRTRGEAMAEWRRLAWASVDDALTRYRIEQRRRDAPPPESERPA
ncbi:MAG: DUF4170 domain-containing protein [Rhodospirillaceae bacterium]|nr:DUF4170 domain-containing protein [Rhodospirillaceae bacterium]